MIPGQEACQAWQPCLPAEVVARAYQSVLLTLSKPVLADWRTLADPSILRIYKLLLGIVITEAFSTLLVDQRCPAAVHTRPSDPLLLVDISVFLVARLLVSGLLWRTSLST